MSTPSLSPVVGEAQASPDLSDLARYTGLSSLEIAAAKTDLHMSTCPLNVWDCPDCAHKLKEHRAILEAVTSRIALTERVRIVSEVRAFADQVRREGLTGPITAGIADLVADRINTLPPVAAALDPTPIPDGEPR